MTKIQFFGILMLALLVAACGTAQPVATQVAPAPTTEQSSPTQEQQAPSQVPPTAETAPQATSTEIEAVATATETIKTEAAPPTVSTGPDGAALLQERCTKCHDLNRVESKSASADQWQKTVERMMGKGAVLSEEEKLALINYLSVTYPN